MREMKAYIGTKIIRAEREDRVSPDATGTEASATQEGYRVVYPDGYVSWSPKGAFETAYREVSDDEKELMKGA